MPSLPTARAAGHVETSAAGRGRRTSDVDGLVVALSGATGGIGRAISARLVRQGAHVILGHHPQEAAAADELATLLTEEVSTSPPELGGGRETGSVTRVELEVTDTRSCERFAGTAAGRFGRIDALVNNAGVMEQTPFETLDEQIWLTTLDVNVNGAYRCIRALLPALRESDRASVVNLSSQMAYAGGPNSAAYCTSKAALLGLTRALAHDLHPQVRVNAVAPGPIRTPMTEQHMSAEYERLKTGRLAMGRFGTPDEVAAAVCFLLGDGATYFTGQTLHPNGGGVMP